MVWKPSGFRSQLVPLIVGFEPHGGRALAQGGAAPVEFRQPVAEIRNGGEVLLQPGGGAAIKVCIQLAAGAKVFCDVQPLGVG